MDDKGDDDDEEDEDVLVRWCVVRVQGREC